MNARQRSRIRQMMRQALIEGVFPGAVLWVSHRNQIEFSYACGYADLFSRQPMTLDTCFDLASLTKPLATTAAVMTLVEQQRLSLTAPVETYLKLAEKQPIGKQSVFSLLTHTAGLPAYRPYFARLAENESLANKRQRMRAWLLQEPLVAPGATPCRYSDLGFMVLEWIVETVAGQRLNRFLHDCIYPLYQLNRCDGCMLGFMPDMQSSNPVAATEFCCWRRCLVKGQVHDENAAALGGVAGHAGLFGTAAGICRLLTTWLAENGGGPISKKTIQYFFSKTRCGRALGFDMPSPHGSSSGRYFSDDTVGHLGFTGVSFWMDRMRHIIVILLTNRVHPWRGNEKLKIFRPCIHDAIMRGLI